MSRIPRSTTGGMCGCGECKLKCEALDKKIHTCTRFDCSIECYQNSNGCMCKDIGEQNIVIPAIKALKIKESQLEGRYRRNDVRVLSYYLLGIEYRTTLR